MRVEFRLSGSGGQGLLLAGIILAEAAILEGKNAVQTQSYGPEARGGASKAEVVISDSDVDYPKVTSADYTLALTEESYKQYGKNLKSGTLIIDQSISLIESNQGLNTLSVPIIKTASEELGKGIVANMVALGALIGASNIVNLESVETAVINRVPKGTEELNLAALRKGYELVKASN
jgi:2-oxoglutarate ferredoxin oxidoreductase subunit gamma